MATAASSPCVRCFRNFLLLLLLLDFALALELLKPFLHFLAGDVGTTGAMTGVVTVGVFRGGNHRRRRRLGADQRECPLSSTSV